MKGNGVFLLRGENDLVEMNSQDFSDEKEFQKLIAKYPNLLAGGQIDQDNPRRWLLIEREFGLPSEEDKSDRWSIDHLFLDQEGIPTIVEVKRSSDTRIRREVVGQMLDYAANCVVYWPVDKLKQKLSERLSNESKYLDEEISNFLNQQMQPEEFWSKVDTNLKTGNIRLLFVADEIPKELKRIVEFLNERMEPTEVLAVQLKQYTSGDHKLLVPTIFGQTSQSEQTKQRIKKQWDYESFVDSLEKTHGIKMKNLFLKIFEWSKKTFPRQ